MKFQEKVRDALGDRLEGITDPQEQQRIANEVAREVERADPTPQREVIEMMEFRKELSDKLKVEMFDVLTDEQWKRMLKLVDNPPDYIQRMRGLIRTLPGNTDNAPDEWQPGPGSWRPGDGIPEGYRIERNTRRQFPRGE